MKIQLWSYNYAPEPTGIGPVSRVLADGLRDRGHDVDVVAAHPHYPAPVWGRRLRPYREVRNGVRVLRLPLWVGRATTAQRYRQELTFMAAQFAAVPGLRRPDVLVSASPSFPALLPAIVNSRVRNIPWVLWLHDILPDGASSTGLVREGAVLQLARRLERSAYQHADRIVVLSSAFTENLKRKGVPEDEIELIYDPATRIPAPRARAQTIRPARILSMGNIGHSQGLSPLVDAFERHDSLREVPVHLVITGNGVAADDVRAKISSDRVHMLGVVNDDRLEAELMGATLGLVTQSHIGAEFNIPSKLMNFMAYGLPVLAVVNPSGEVARIVRAANAGWVVDSSRPDDFPTALKEILRHEAAIANAGEAACRYAATHFSPNGFSQRFERLLETVVQSRQNRLPVASPRST